MMVDSILTAAQCSLNLRCFEIVQEISSSNQFIVTLEFVIQILLQRYGVADFRDLNVGSMKEIPALMLLTDIHQKINAFISCYFGSRSIISYRDLQYELVQMLLSFSIPSVMSVHADCQRISLQENKDPNEIEIEDDIASDKEIGDSDQNEAGTGSKDIASMSSDYLITSEDLLTHLAQSESIDLRNSTTAELEFFLCKEYEVHNLQDIGIIITGNLKLELVMISHVHAARTRILTKIQKKQLDEYARQERQITDNYPSSGHGNRKKAGQCKTNISGISAIETMGKEITLSSKSDLICAVKLTASSNTRVASFVDQCATFLSDSPYSPSYAKVLEAVDKVSRDSSKNNNNEVDHDKGMQKKRKRRKNEAKSCSSDEITDWKSLESPLDVFDPPVGLENGLLTENITENCNFHSNNKLLEVVADYVMLFLGGEKYRAKRFSEDRIKDQIEIAEVTSPTENFLEDSYHDDVIIDIKNSEIVCDDQGSVIELVVKPDCYDGNTDSINNDTKNDNLIDGNKSIHKVQNIAINIDTSLDVKSDDENNVKQDGLIIDMVEEKIPFECKLFSLQNYNLTTGSSSLTQNINGESSIYNINNNKLREISPWCGGFTGGGESKGAAVLDVNDLRAVGRWGEAMVYQYLLAQSLPSSSSSSLLSPTVEWLNIEEETRAGYDLIVRQPKKLRSNGIGTTGRNSLITETTYIEVKTTRFDDLNTFEISLWEWQFATSNPRVRYQIYRVFNAGDSKRVRIVVIEDLLELITLRKVRLCLNV